jgi:hypothetical protein
MVFIWQNYFNLCSFEEIRKFLSKVMVIDFSGVHQDARVAFIYDLTYCDLKHYLKLVLGTNSGDTT